MNIVYNGATSRTQIELTYDPKALNCWERFELDWAKFWSSKAGQVLGIGMLVAATVLAFACPAFLPLYKAALIVTGLSLAVGGVIAGFSSQSSGDPFWDGFSDYLDDNWSQTVALEMGTSMLMFGVNSAANAVYNARSARKAAAVEREVYSLEGLSPNEKGKMGEEYISRTRNLKKNTRTYKMPQKMRIPDFMDDGKHILIESKNVKKLGKSAQLADYASWAKQNGWRMEIYVRQNTTTNASFEKFIVENAINIKYFPWR